MTDWRAGIDDVDAALLDAYQRDIPLEERPFREVAAAVGATERDVVRRLSGLVDAGLVRRVGPVLDPAVLGSSTLAALAVPPAHFDAVAEAVNSFDQVNHNYERDHELNMWFVVTAPTRSGRDAILERIAERTGLDPLVVPMVTQYDIDLAFPVVNDDRLARTGRPTGSDDVSPTPVTGTAPDLSRFDRAVVMAVQAGLPLVTTPYRSIADDLDAATADVLEVLRRLRSRRAIKRVGCVLDHHALGFTRNAMVAWAVPTAEIDDRGVRAAEHPAVTYCCRRRARPDRGWPYDLFTMIHGRSRRAVEGAIEELAAGPLPVEFDRLPTETVRKQTGVRYDDLLREEADGRRAAVAGGERKGRDG